jgi:ATP-dependent DNA helicase RecG
MLFEEFLDISENLFKKALNGEETPSNIERFMFHSLSSVKDVPPHALERMEKFCKYFFGLSKLPEERKKIRLQNGLLMVEKMRKDNLTALPPEPSKKEIDIDSPVKFAKKVGPSREEHLNHLGIFTIRELLYHFPRTHDDWRKPLNILSLRPGERVCATANIVDVEKKRVKNYVIVTAIITDGFSNMYLVWFNQEYIYNTIKSAKRIAFSGIVKNNHGQYQVSSPDFEIVDEKSVKITPIYDLTAGISQKMMRLIMEANMPYVHLLEEPLPAEVLERRKLLDVKRAMYGIHFPASEYHLSSSRKRLAYEEFFLLEVSQLMVKKKLQSKGGVAKHFERKLSESFIKSLPFELTNGQKRAVKEIESDLSKPLAMNRLLQGDVGSGKTVVAEISILDVIESGFQVAFMAPTYVLASQHFERLKVDLENQGVKIDFLTGATPSALKKEIKERITTGEVNVVVGTHALIQKDVVFKNLGLVVIDEQHKFGVRQREALMSKGKAVDTLFMTATPIPRTLSMTIYGDLDITIIDEMPVGRKQPKTLLVNNAKREEVFDFVKEEIKNGTGIFWISPLVEESEKLDVKAAKEIYEEFVNGPFEGYNVGLLYGKMPSEEKEKVMKDFEMKKVEILVSTTVIEVGIDIPHANVMVIEHPERFGLAQLHQLRGRIGRGGKKSYCILLTNGGENERLRYFTHTFNGFELSNYDLRLRGPGEFMGTRQHGLPEFKVADLIRDEEILQEAKMDAEELVEADFELKDHPNLMKEIKRRYGERIKFVEVG